MQIRELRSDHRNASVDTHGCPLSHMPLLSRPAGEKVDARPGAEILAAAREADALGARVWPGDRSILITVARVWAALSAWEKVKLISFLLYGGLNAPDAEEMRILIEKSKEMDAQAEVRAPTRRAACTKRELFLHVGWLTGA